MTRMFSATGTPAREPPVFAPVDRQNDSLRAGIAWMLVAAFLFVCQDALARLLLATYPATEVAFVRYAIHMVFVAALIASRDPRLMISRRPILQLARSGFLLAATLLVMAALPIMPLVDVSAVVWIAPVLVTALAFFLLGERVSLRGWLCVLTGLAGVWLIVSQAGIDLTPAMVVPFLAALANALYQIATRMLRGSDAPLTTLFYTGVVGTFVCAVFLPFVMILPDLSDAGLMALLGGFGILSHFCLIRAFTAAPANLVAPFGYTSLVWAGLFSLFLFSEMPGSQTLAGAALIVGAGLALFMNASKA
jgi:drug/metabolite transporter (DMT)-like permease